MSVSAFPYGVFAGRPGIVTVSGESISDIQVLTTATAGVRFNADGTIDKNVTGVYSQIDSGTDWLIPNAAAPSLYQVYAAYTGVAPSGAATNTWLDLTSNREWTVVNSGPGGTDVCTLTVSIRYNGGGVIDSGVFTLSSQYIP